MKGERIMRNKLSEGGIKTRGPKSPDPLRDRRRMSNHGTGDRCTLPERKDIEFDRPVVYQDHHQRDGDGIAPQKCSTSQDDRPKSRRKEPDPAFRWSVQNAVVTPERGAIGWYCTKM